jgi:hypothetical protein
MYAAASSVVIIRSSSMVDLLSLLPEIARPGETDRDPVLRNYARPGLIPLKCHESSSVVGVG